MAEGQVYDIPEGGLKWFREKMTSLGKRAERLVGEKLFMTVVGFHREEDPKNRFFNHKIMEVFVAYPEPKLNGWEFIARIDHANEVGNVIRNVGGKEVPLRYRTSEPICDHCNYKRKRRDSFVVYHEETDSYKQVGTSCLKDFLGHPGAEKWAKLAELIASIGEIQKTSREYMGGSNNLQDLRWIDLESVAGLAAMSVLDRGWVSRKSSETYGKPSTRSDVWARMYHSGTVIDQEARILAEQALEWARGLDQNTANDYEHNCFVIANAEAIEPRSMGIAVSIVGVYFNKMKNPAPRTASSQYFGRVLTKFEDTILLESVKVGENSNRHVMRDAYGNLLVWFASSENLREYIGKKLQIKGTVKAHQEYNGTKQTVVNRIKVINVLEEEGFVGHQSEIDL